LLAAAAACEASSASATTPGASTASSTSDSSPSGGRTSKESAKADSNSAPDSSDIEASFVSGNTYKNAVLEMTFQFPQRLILASTETLRKVNDRREAAAKAAVLEQQPGACEFPKYGNAQNSLLRFMVEERGMASTWTSPSFASTPCPHAWIP
jgi:hypothetical protein